MPPILIFLLGGFVKDIAAGFLFFRLRAQRRDNLTCRRWLRRPKIPFVNWFLKYKAGKPANVMERKRNSAIVGAARALVNTETFEHIVGAALNARSNLKIKMPDSLRKANAGVPRRHWGKVTIVS